MHHDADARFDVPAIRDFVPVAWKPLILLVFVVLFQFSGGVYLAVVNEMTGTTALLQEDIMMAGYASLVGMSMIFAIIFRLKHRFKTRTVFLICPAVIIAANIIAMTTRSVPVLVAVCFVAGFFRMWGTFECNSLLQLWITPKRDLSVFFCYIFLLVQSCISLSGTAHALVAFVTGWPYVHLLMAGVLAAMIPATLILFNDRRVMPYVPLYGVDWTGMVLWSVSALSVLFVCTYGDHYDWFYSPYICAGAVAAAVAAVLNVWRASFIRHPFIANDLWHYPIVWKVIVSYLLFDMLMSPSHLLEHLYFGEVLGYDLRHAVSMNWAVIAGTVAGAWFTWRTFSKRGWPWQVMTAIAFAAVTAYLMIFYFTVDADLPKRAFAVPLFLRGFGYVVLAITLLTAMSPRVPFVHFFQGVAVQNTVSASIAGAAGAAVLTEILKRVWSRNAMLAAGGADGVNVAAARMNIGELWGAVEHQSLLVSLKEIFGILTIAGLALVAILILRAVISSRTSS